MTAAVRWLSLRMSDPRRLAARAYYAVKVPLAGPSLAVAGYLAGRPVLPDLPGLAGAWALRA